MKRFNSILVTGGAGFIGSAVCRRLTSQGYRVVNVDKLTYAGNLGSLGEITSEPSYAFHQADICDGSRMVEIMRSADVDAIMHLAAETHVDRSIDGPAMFLQTNVTGTFQLLDAALTYWRGLSGSRRSRFRFHHVSTDEVFGDLPFESGAFNEASRYAPSSPYAASKASSDHLVRAWHATYGLPTVVSHSSNNYGPFQFPEKLIPLVIVRALTGKPLPIYGDGLNARDWLHVDDHCRALELILTEGVAGRSYVVGGRAERTNLAVVQTICDALDAKRPLPGGASRRGLITFVSDRPGHDRRYAVDPSELERQLGWNTRESFETGIERTIDWYLGNEWWWRPILEQHGASRTGSSCAS